MAFNKILKKLESLPRFEQEFAAGRYIFEIVGGKTHCGCAIGKLFSEEKRLLLAMSEANSGGVSNLYTFLNRRYYYENEEEKSRREAKQELEDLGATVEELIALQHQNDTFASGSNDLEDRKLRYWYIIGWLRGITRAPVV